jgi:hypothetical protein
MVEASVRRLLTAKTGVGITASAVEGSKYTCSTAIYLSANMNFCSYFGTPFLFF